MTIQYCDRCGKEVDKSMWKIKAHAVDTATRFDYELCSECTLKFRHWIEDKPAPCKQIKELKEQNNGRKNRQR